MLFYHGIKYGRSSPLLLLNSVAYKFRCMKDPQGHIFLLQLVERRDLMSMSDAKSSDGFVIKAVAEESDVFSSLQSPIWLVYDVLVLSPTTSVSSFRTLPTWL